MEPVICAEPIPDLPRPITNVPSMRNPLSSLLIAAAMTLPVFAHATAEKEGIRSLEEIVVTSRKTAENPQSIPVAISAFSKHSLRIFQVENIGDLQALVPNLSLHTGDASNAVVYIRGVGQIDALAFSEPGVGVYVDDAYLGRAQGSFLDITDVERIEVLRGPQGTLYGRNTIGGAVKYFSAGPGNEFKGYLEGSYGNHDRTNIKASVGGPIVADVMAGKFNIALMTRDGYASNAYAGNGDGDGDKDTLAWRGMLTLDPSENLNAHFSIDRTDANPNHSRSPTKESACCTFATTAPVAADADPFKLNVNYNTIERTLSEGVALHVDWQASDVLSLKSITAYREMEYNGELDLDGTTNRIFDVFFNVDQNQLSQEFQVILEQEAVKIISGYYWFDEASDSFDGIIGPEAVGTFVFAGRNRNSTESQAIFGEMSYAWTDALTLSIGGRWTDEKKELTRTADLFLDLTALPPGDQLSQNDLRDALGSGFNVSNLNGLQNNWHDSSFRVALDWQINHDAMLYFSIAEGFKSGGFNGRSNDLLDPSAADPFAAEQAVSFELGLKSDWLAHRLRINGALFHTDYDNLQVQFPTMAALPAFENVGKATIGGAEFEALYLVTDALTLHAILGYLDAEIDKFVEQGVDVTGMREMVNAPRWDGYVGFSYEQPVSLGLLRLTSGYGFRSKSYLTISGSELLAQGDYGLWDASVSLTSSDETWQVTLGGKNLGDTVYRNHGFDLSGFPGVQLGYYGAPRSWSLTGRYNF